MRIKLLYTIATLCGLSLLLMQCRKTTETDKALFERSNTTAGFTYYMNNDSVLPSSSPSAHNAYFRVRFNSIAYAALTDNGKLPAGGSFPDG